MNTSFTEVVKAKFERRNGYLVFSQDDVIFVDLDPTARSLPEPSSSWKETIPVVGEYQAIKSTKNLIKSARSGEDTDEKKRLRGLFEAYRKSRDKNLLNSVSREDVMNADFMIKLFDRIIPFSSVVNVRVKEPGRFKKGLIEITQQVSRESLSGRKYSRKITREYQVSEDKTFFLTLFELLHKALPGKLSK